MRGLVAAALVWAGCTPDGAMLIVDVRTDYLPGVEFSSIFVELEPAHAGIDALHRPITRRDDLLSGYRAGELAPLPAGTHEIRAQLRDVDDAVVAERRVRVTMAGATVATVVLTRSCAGVVCPGALGDPTGTECLDGRCVRPECRPETPDSCGPPACATDPDCPAPAAACASTICTERSCLVHPSDDACSPGATCHPALGCVGGIDVDGGVADAGVADAGPVDGGASDAGADAGPPPCQCSPGATRSGSCTACQEQVCGADCRWGSCQDQAGIQCSPRETRGGSCDSCQEQVCGSNCRWGSCRPRNECADSTDCRCCSAGGLPGWQCCRTSTCEYYTCTTTGACGAGCC